MKKWSYRGVMTTSFLKLLFLGYYVIKFPYINESYFTSFVNFTNPSPESTSQVISAQVTPPDFSAPENLSKKEQSSLQTWNRLKNSVSYRHAQALPNAAEAISEAAAAWKNLINSVEDEKRKGSFRKRREEKHCPHFVGNNMNVSQIDGDGFFKLAIPCGLARGSSITFIGIPNGSDFRVNMIGEQLPGERNPPIILHYNVRLNGDNVTKDPVIVQNTWTIVRYWREEERCPSPNPEKNTKVDELDRCNDELLIEENNHTVVKADNRRANAATQISLVDDGKSRKSKFPFKQNDLFVATMRVGSQGIRMEVDGKHISSFRFRETLEPWLVSEVRISGDLNLTSVVANGLPTSENLEPIIDDSEALKAVPIPYRRKLNLFVGIFSTANNFERRMAIRRSWMQYPQVRSGHVVVRFFVGLHKNKMVNEELWDEARTYGDIQLMPFVDYYSIITMKTIAICIFGTEIVSAKYIMKTDDDAFVRVDEILNSLLGRKNTTRGLLYGLINSDSKPHRDTNSKWYITPEEYAEDKYPPWAHGPGYVVSNDVARRISKKQRKGRLKMFKLEDVAMGIWIEDMKKKGLEVRYENDERIFNTGCEKGYVVAHYQRPRELLCLWRKIQNTKHANCCGE